MRLEYIAIRKYRKEGVFMVDIEALTKQLFNEYLKWVKKEGKKDNLSNYIYWYNEVKQLSRANKISSL